MNRREAEELDRHITGNYGEDQFMEYGEKLFDVTCVIGSVRSGGDQSPMQAAFALIADHQAEGQFRFPGEDGGEIVVTVEYVHPKTDEDAI